jgi:hypothetical protein
MNRLVAAAGAACALLQGCAGNVQVTPLATGQVAVQAFELRGREPAVLRAEAARLCQGKGAVLRESAMLQQLQASDGRIGHWLNQASDWMLLPTRESQLMVRCEPQPERERLAPPMPAGADLLPAAPYPGQRAGGRGGYSPQSSGKSSPNASATASAGADSAVPYGY